MKNLLLLLVSLCLLLTYGSANAASFDCAKAQTPREDLICSTPQLSADDTQLGTVYSTAVSVLPPAEAQALRQDQRGWLKGLDTWCFVNQPSVPPVKCLDQAYQGRIAELPNVAVKQALTAMPSDPTAAERVFQHYDTDLAKLGLALDLRLLLPDPKVHDTQISQLLNGIVPPNFSDDVPGYNVADYDGSVRSLVPYIVAASQDQDGIQLPFSCDLIEKFPVLLDGTIGGYGSSMDGTMPQVACDGSRFAPGAVAKAYEATLRQADDANPTYCGTQVYGILSGNIYQDWIVYLLPAALLDTTKYDGDSSDYLRQLHKMLAPEIAKIPAGPEQTPLADWIYSSPDAYQFRTILTLFPAAQEELEQRYETLFGFSKPDAQLAARRGAWLLQDAVRWASPGATDTLAKAILTHAPLPVVAKQAQAASANGGLDQEYLEDAVVNPPALAVLLQQKPDVNAADDDGITPLMEAATENQPDAVKLLLAAGAKVNLADISGQQAVQNDNYDCMGEEPLSNLDPNHPGGQTALMLAAANAGLPVIQQLLAGGADKAAKDDGGQTALDALNNRLQFQTFLAQHRQQISGLVPLSPSDSAAARHLLEP